MSKRFFVRDYERKLLRMMREIFSEVDDGRSKNVGLIINYDGKHFEVSKMVPYGIISKHSYDAEEIEESFSLQ